MGYSPSKQARHSVSGDMAVAPIMPARETMAQLGRRPTIALFEEGLRIDPQVSDPSPTIA